MRKSPLPFAKLFKYASPKDFIALFASEIPQAMAFILSFSPNKKYVRKVLRLLDGREAGEADPTRKASFAIREYLNQWPRDSFSLAFVQAVEKEVESAMAECENDSYSRKIRKRLAIKHPPDTRKFLKAGGEDERKRKGDPFGGLKGAEEEG
jgi:hypothetical protein